MDSKSLAPVGSFKYWPSPVGYSFEGMCDVLHEELSYLLAHTSNPLLLLSGGVDSAVLMNIMAEIADGAVAYLTVGESLNHPDMVASIKLLQNLPAVHVKYVPQGEDIERAERILWESGTKVCSGDVGVFLALEKAASLGYTDIIAGDGIDEQVGGYWQHANLGNSIREVFIDFWNDLDSEHLGPMARSAKLVGVSVHWPYMDWEVIRYIAKIPLQDRVKYKVPKYWWKEFAKYSGVPADIAERPKQGFIHALNREA